MSAKDLAVALHIVRNCKVLGHVLKRDRLVQSSYVTWLTTFSLWHALQEAIFSFFLSF